LTTVWGTLSRNRVLCSSIYLFMRLLSLQINWKHLEGRAGSLFFWVAHTYIRLSLWEALWVRLSPHQARIWDTLRKRLLVDRYKIHKCLGKQTRICEAGDYYWEQVQCVPLTDSANDVLRAVATESHPPRDAHHTDFLRFSGALFFTLLSLGSCKKAPFFPSPLADPNHARP